MRDDARSAADRLVVDVRDAGLEDVAFLAASNIAMAEETEGRRLDPAVVGRGLRAVLSDPGRGAYYIAEVDPGEPAGCLMITREWSDWRDGFFMWIQSVYVLPGHRGRGVFRALYDHVVEHGKGAQDVRGIRLYVEKQNERARAVYETCGMALSPYRLYEMEFSE